MYLAQITTQNNGGCYRKQDDSLDDIRTWAKSVGRSGDSLMIMRNGDKLANARHFTI